MPELLPMDLALVLILACCNPRNASRDCCRPSTIFSKLSMIRRSISSATAMNLGSLGSMWNVSVLVLVLVLVLVGAVVEAEAEVERGANRASMSIITSTMSTTRLFVHVRHEPDRNDCRGGMTMSSVFRSLDLLAVGCRCWIALAWFVTH